MAHALSLSFFLCRENARVEEKQRFLQLFLLSVTSFAHLDICFAVCHLHQWLFKVAIRTIFLYCYVVDVSISSCLLAEKLQIQY